MSSTLVESGVGGRLAGRVVVVKSSTATSATTVTTGISTNNRVFNTSKSGGLVVAGGGRSTGPTQLPSPLPSPPPQPQPPSSLPSLIRHSIGNSNTKHDSIILIDDSHSTPPQSPSFTMNTNHTAAIIVDDSKLAAVSSSSSLPPVDSIGASTESQSTTTVSSTAELIPIEMTSSAAAQVVVEAHTPPESNDGSEMKHQTSSSLDSRTSRLAYLNALNDSFRNEFTRSITVSLEETRHRLRSIQVACFNQYIASYLDSKQDGRVSSADDQVVGDEIAYELVRRREEDESVTSSSSSSASEDEDDDIYENEHLNFNNTTTASGDHVNIIDDNSEQQLFNRPLNYLSADDYWHMRRVELGSEWTRVHAKMALLKRRNAQLNQYLASEREIEKLSRSLKDSIKQAFSDSSHLDDDDQDSDFVDVYEENLDDDLALPSRLPTAARVSRPCKMRQQRRRQRRRGMPRNSTYKFNELVLLKSFYVTLMHMRTSLFDKTCVCGGGSSSDGSSSAASLLDTTCIFCHMFKKYESEFVHDVKRTAPSLPSQSQHQYIRADERVIRLYHSYCKQPKYGEKLSWSSEQPQQQLRRVGEDDELGKFEELSRLASERADDLFNASSRQLDENENVQQQPTVKDEFDEIAIIDPGYEISLDDIKKLPIDFSYDELKFLCEDVPNLDENDLTSNPNKRKEQEETSLDLTDTRLTTKPLSISGDPKRLRLNTR